MFFDPGSPKTFPMRLCSSVNVSFQAFSSCLYSHKGGTQKKTFPWSAIKQFHLFYQMADEGYSGAPRRGVRSSYRRRASGLGTFLDNTSMSTKQPGATKGPIRLPPPVRSRFTYMGGVEPRNMNDCAHSGGGVRSAVRDSTSKAAEVAAGLHQSHAGWGGGLNSTGLRDAVVLWFR